MNAVDTNIFLYSIDQNEPIKQAKAQQLFRRLLTSTAPTFLIWQVLAECVQQLRRWRDQGRINHVEFDNHVQAFRNVFPIVLPTSAILDHALDLSNRFSLSHWDSMILGACKDAGITTLFTEDMGAPRIIDGIQLVNPVI